MSFFKVGDQSIHLNFVQDYLVTKHKWLSESSFKEIRDLCWNLPGPTIQQIPLTIVILKTKSISSGLKCFFIYNMVPWTLIGLISILVNVFNFTKDSLSEGWSIIFLGCNAAVAGLMMRSFLTFTSHFLWNWPKMLLILTTTVLFIIFQSSTVLIFCMIFSGLVSLYL
jgi:chromate transport protein ChrA